MTTVQVSSSATRVPITCRPSRSAHSPNSASVLGSICSSLSTSTNPHSGLVALTTAVATRSCSEPLMSDHEWPPRVMRPSSDTPMPSSGSSAPSSSAILAASASATDRAAASCSASAARAASSALCHASFSRTIWFARSAPSISRMTSETSSSTQAEAAAAASASAAAAPS